MSDDQENLDTIDQLVESLNAPIEPPKIDQIDLEDIQNEPAEVEVEPPVGETKSAETPEETQSAETIEDLELALPSIEEAEEDIQERLLDTQSQENEIFPSQSDESEPSEPSEQIKEANTPEKLDAPEFQSPQKVAQPQNNQENEHQNIQIINTPKITKSMQPLTSLEPIQTPKLFQVAKDNSLDVAETPSTPSHRPSHVSEMDFNSSLVLDLDLISNFLNVGTERLSDIDESILTKFQNTISSLSNLRSENLIMEVRLEQLSHLNNSKLNNYKTQITELSNENLKLNSLNGELSSDVERLSQSITTKDSEIQLLKENINVNLAAKADAVRDKGQSLEMLASKSKEIESLQNELKSVNSVNTNLRNDLLVLNNSNNKLTSENLLSKLEAEKLGNEVKSITQNSQWFEKELRSKNDMLLELRKSSTREISTLNSKLDRMDIENTSLTQSKASLNERLNELTSKNDQSFIKIKKLNDSISSNQDIFTREMQSKDKLIDLYKKSSEDRKTRIVQLEESIESLRTGFIAEQSQLVNKLNTEIESKERLSERIRQLESTIDDFMNGAAGSNEESSVPFLSTSAKATAAKFPGVSLSELYSDFSMLKKQLVQEKRSKERMQQQIDEFVDELERKAPIIEATRERSNFLEIELSELSSTLESVNQEKDLINSDYKKLQQQLRESQLEIQSLNQQRIDLSRQIQTLLIQITIRGDSNGPLTSLEQEAIERILSDEPSSINESDTDRLISQRLVTFQNINELSSKNQELLKIIRQLGSKLEQQEIANKEKLSNLESVAVDEAKEAIITLSEQIDSVNLKLESVTRERDMFRSILSNKSHSSESTPSPPSTSEIKVLVEKNSKIENQLKENEKLFNVLKSESSSTINRLTLTINELNSEKTSLSIQLSKLKSSISLNEERHNFLKESLKFSQTENNELRNANQLIQNNLSKQDLKTQQVAEELIDTKSLMDSLKYEIINLKAEKSLWKSIEMRINEDNANLNEEKIKLNSSISNLQTLLSERERSNAESARRLNGQVESLTRDVQNLQHKYDESSKDLRNLITRKEADSNAYQERIDQLSNELSSIRQSLVAKTTSVEHLENKLESIERQFASAESKVRIYETQSQGSDSTLSSELSRAKVELNDAKSDLEAANKEVEQFKSIASAAEEALQSMNNSFDEFKSASQIEHDNLLEENNTNIQEISELKEEIISLEQRLAAQREESIQEIESLNSQILQLKNKSDEAEKIKEECERKVSEIQSDLSNQAKIAHDAQENYEKELQKHAEVSRTLGTLREATNDLKSRLNELSVESETAKDALVSAEKSWESQKSTLEEELRVSKSKVHDLNYQNRILLNQLESLSADRSQVTENFEANNDSFLPEGSNDEIREVISYLRREKEISEANLEVQIEEQKRLRQRLEFTTSELDNVRGELLQFQVRDARADKLNEEHEKLLGQLNQLNILRESNTTLRNESQVYLKNWKETEVRLVEVTTKLEPLQNEVGELKAEIEIKDQHVRLAQEDNERWKKRSQDILQKYNRIDPVEHESLKKELETLKENSADVESLKKNLEQMSEAAANFEKRYNVVKDEAQKKLHDRHLKALAMRTDLQKAQDELALSKSDLVKAKEEYTKEIDELKANLKSQGDEAVNATGDGKVQQITAEFENMKKQYEELQIRSENSIQEVISQKNTLDAEVVALKQEIEALKNSSTPSSQIASNSDFVKELEKLNAEHEAEKLAMKEEHAKEQEKLRSQVESERPKVDSSIAADSAVNQDSELLKKTVREELEIEYADKLEEHKRKIRAPAESRIQEFIKRREEKLQEEFDVREKESNDKFEARVKDAVDKEISKSQTSGGDVDAAKKIREFLTSEYESKIEALKAENQKAIEKAIDEARISAEKMSAMKIKMLNNKLEKLQPAAASASDDTAATTQNMVPSSLPSSLPSAIPSTTPSAIPSSVPARPTSEQKSDVKNVENTSSPTKTQPDQSNAIPVRQAASAVKNDSEESSNKSDISKTLVSTSSVNDIGAGTSKIKDSSAASEASLVTPPTTIIETKTPEVKAPATVSSTEITQSTPTQAAKETPTQANRSSQVNRPPIVRPNRGGFRGRRGSYSLKRSADPSGNPNAKKHK